MAAKELNKAMVGKLHSFLSTAYAGQGKGSKKGKDADTRTVRDDLFAEAVKAGAGNRKGDVSPYLIAIMGSLNIKATFDNIANMLDSLGIDHNTANVTADGKTFRRMAIARPGTKLTAAGSKASTTTVTDLSATLADILKKK